MEEAVGTASYKFCDFLVVSPVMFPSDPTAASIATTGRVGEYRAQNAIFEPLQSSIIGIHDNEFLPISNFRVKRSNDDHF